MYKYTTTDLIKRALNLADLNNSDFISFGEQFNYVNDAYRAVYQDAINAGEELYVKECLLDGSGSRSYDLPSDLYQIIAITDGLGETIRRKKPVEANTTTGYRIVNNTIILDNIFGGCTLKYIPVPETLTYRAPVKKIDIPFDVVSSFGTMVADTCGNVWDISTAEYLVEDQDTTLNNVCLGANSITYTNAGSNIIKNFSGDSQAIISNLVLTEDGRFIASPFTSSQKQNTIGCISDDGEHCFYINTENKLCHNGDVIADFTSSVIPASIRYVYWDGKPSCIANGYLFTNSGEYAELINSDAMLLKTDIDTGYGFIYKYVSEYYVTGWLPETAIDYPNNIFFSMVAYKLAMAYRTKQNADITLLNNEYQNLIKTYASSLSNNAQDYPTIRNVYSNRGWY